MDTEREEERARLRAEQRRRKGRPAMKVSGRGMKRFAVPKRPRAR